jgi:hypothetical protein
MRNHQVGTKIHRMNEKISRSEISLRDEFEAKPTMNKNGEAEIKSRRFLWAGLRAIVVDAALNTSMHGLRGIFHSKYLLLRIMWLVCLLGSSGICAYLLMKSVQDYLNYDVVTVTSTVYEAPAIFPVNYFS